MSRNFRSLLDPGCDLDRCASDEEKVVAVLTSIQTSLFKVTFTAEILFEALRNAGADGEYAGRNVYEVLEDVRAKAAEALHVLADDEEVADMYRVYAAVKKEDGDE